MGVIKNFSKNLGSAKICNYFWGVRGSWKVEKPWSRALFWRFEVILSQNITVYKVWYNDTCSWKVYLDTLGWSEYGSVRNHFPWTSTRRSFFMNEVRFRTSEIFSVKICSFEIKKHQMNLYPIIIYTYRLFIPYK